MTVVPSGGANLPGQLDDDLDTGLEDFGVEDAVVPRLQIVHKEGLYRDSLSNQTFDKLSIIILGLVKQRVLWHHQFEDGDFPMCKSPDHKDGYPNIDEDTRKDKRFPWDKSGFRPEDFPPDEFGVVKLPCAGCRLKEWKTHPDGKKPYCSELYTLPVLMDPWDAGSWTPAILTIQKTGIKPLKAYLSGFQRMSGAAYQAITEITLDRLSRGTTDYSVPKFRQIGTTDSTEWRAYSNNYKSLKNFLEQPPTRREDDELDSTPPDNVAQPAQAQSTPAPPAEVKKDQTSVPPQASDGQSHLPEDDDDLPF